MGSRMRRVRADERTRRDPIRTARARCCVSAALAGDAFDPASEAIDATETMLGPAVSEFCSARLCACLCMPSAMKSIGDGRRSGCPWTKPPCLPWLQYHRRCDPMGPRLGCAHNPGRSQPAQPDPPQHAIGSPTARSLLWRLHRARRPRSTNPRSSPAKRHLERPTEVQPS